MKGLVVLCFVFLSGLLGISASTSVNGDVKRMRDIKALDLSVKPGINFGKIPLYFITNNGQVNKRAKFYARASRYILWLTKEGLVFDSMKAQGAAHSVTSGGQGAEQPGGEPLVLKMGLLILPTHLTHLTQLKYGVMFPG